MTATDEELRDLFAQLIDNDRREGISAESTADGVIAFAKLGREQVLAITAERDRYRSAWLSARRRAEAWRGEYATVAEQRTGWDERYISRALYDQNVRAVHKRNERVVWQLCGEQQKAEAAQAERDQLLASLRAAAVREREQARRINGERRARIAAEKERDELRAQVAAAGLVPIAQPPGATVLPCSSVLFRTFDGATWAHLSHTWAPQPGVTPVWCPGVAPVPEEPLPAALRAAGLDPATITVHATPKET